MNLALEVKNLTKVFYAPVSYLDLVKFNFKGRKPTYALDGLSFSLQKGKILGILGPNGAGKTTLLKIISTLILPDKGEVIVSGLRLDRNEEKIKSRIGFASADERSFYWRLSGRQNLEFYATLYGLPKSQIDLKISELLKIFNINYENKRFDFYSSGMKIKFSLIRALLHNPQILLFDEPTKSLDYNSSLEIRQLIKKMAKNNKSIILVNHNIREAEDICDMFIILNKGRMLASGSLKKLKEETNSDSLEQIYTKFMRNV